MNDVSASESTLEILELSPTEWRVNDRRIADGDPSAILGFIQQVGSFFEVLSLDRLQERSYFSPFQRATETFTSGRSRAAIT